ncbi:MAG TPA: ribonucleotide reductase N-terminal alpha domain-containing protein, partial [Terricaulis sp.]|nr:ribonucleotide reductase N-terminal alpha domain-containing protein [Terricaulis sp.]
MPFDADISAEIWNAKYRFRSDGDLGDEDVNATWARVAAAIAEAEPARARRHWRTQFESALSDFKFLPAGRIIAGAGTGRSVTLFNCFVMGTIPDNLDGIFEH